MTWLSALLGFLSDLFAKVFMKAMETPARKENVDVQEGDAPAPKRDAYAGRYGLSDRDQGKP